MQIHQLKPTKRTKPKKRYRGGKKGGYCGRGIKGQKARSGRKLPPIVRELIKRYPKLRGYRQKTKERVKKEINLFILEEKFKPEEKVTPQSLIEKKIISKIKGKIPQIKILAKGSCSKKLIIENCQVSKGAREKIEKVGGIVKESN